MKYDIVLKYRDENIQLQYHYITHIKYSRKMPYSFEAKYVLFWIRSTKPILSSTHLK